MRLGELKQPWRLVWTMKYQYQQTQEDKEHQSLWTTKTLLESQLVVESFPLLATSANMEEKHPEVNKEINIAAAFIIKTLLIRFTGTRLARLHCHGLSLKDVHVQLFCIFMCTQTHLKRLNTKLYKLCTPTREYASACPPPANKLMVKKVHLLPHVRFSNYGTNSTWLGAKLLIQSSKLTCWCLKRHSYKPTELAVICCLRKKDRENLSQSTEQKLWCHGKENIKHHAGNIRPFWNTNKLIAFHGNNGVMINY